MAEPAPAGLRTRYMAKSMQIIALRSVIWA